MVLPREHWAIVVRPLRRPRVVAVCDNCFGHLGERALWVYRGMGMFFVVVGEGNFDERARKMRALVGDGPVAGVAE